MRVQSLGTNAQELWFLVPYHCALHNCKNLPYWDQKKKKKKSAPIAREKRPKFLKANLDKVSQFFEHSVVFLVFKDKSILLTILLDLKTSSKLHGRLLPQKKDLTCSKY